MSKLPLADSAIIAKLAKAGLNQRIAVTLPTISALQKSADCYSGSERMIAQLLILQTFNTAVYQLYSLGVIDDDALDVLIALRECPDNKNPDNKPGEY